jgi:class 3 adenylate cyclase
MTATGVVCGSCGTELPRDSRFCNKCGSPITPAATSAEYKQVTVLFADVVHSMDIAAAAGPERLREIMTELVNSAAVVVQRYGGTVGRTHETDDASSAANCLVENAGDRVELPGAADERRLTAATVLLITDRDQAARRHRRVRTFDVYKLRLGQDGCILNESRC